MKIRQNFQKFCWLNDKICCNNSDYIRKMSVLRTYQHYQTLVACSNQMAIKSFYYNMCLSLDIFKLSPELWNLESYTTTWIFFFLKKPSKLPHWIHWTSYLKLSVAAYIELTLITEGKKNQKGISDYFNSFHLGCP